MKRKLTAWLLVLVMAVTLLPAASLAAEAPGLPDVFVDPLTGWGAYDQLIAASRTERDMAARAQMLHEAEDLLMSTGCIVPLYYYCDHYLQKSSVQNVFVDVYGTKYFAYASNANGADTLRICLASEPYTIDPSLNSAVDGACLISSAFSGLYGFGPDGKIGPACADHYTVSDDGLTWTVTLRDGLKWSDGSALTAADFAYAWQRTAADETMADYSYLFEIFEGYPNALNVQALDDVTLRFVLTAPCPSMESMMAFPTFYPQQRAAVEADPEGWCSEAGFVSNGPFTLTEWTHDGTMTFTKNPLWYDADRVSLQTLQFVLSADVSEMMRLYNSGGLDFLDDYDPALLQDEAEHHVVTNLGLYYLSFNAASSLFADKTPEQAACMRLAMSLAIDRNAISAEVGNQRAADTFIPRGMSDCAGGLFHPDDEPGYFDPDDPDALDHARELLRSAGYTFDADGKLSEPLTVRYVYNQSSGHARIASLVASSLAQLGIGFETTEMSWSDYLHRDPANYDLARGGWIADFNDPREMLALWTSDSPNNTCGFAAADPSAPVITQQPRDFEGAVGETATFAVKAVGDGLTYQWQYREPGSSTWLNSSFKTPSMTCKITAARDGRAYHCIVTDARGNSVTSEPAAIIVRQTLAITQQPQDFEGAVGETATFSVQAAGDGLTYQWQYREPGSSTWLNSSFKTPSMTCKITAARDGRQYHCIVTDARGSSVTSEPAAIIVKAPALAITQQPQDFTGAVGETATFTVKAVGEGLTYQWQYKDPGKEWANSSFKTPSMSCKLTAARDGRQYRCIVQDAHENRLYSDAATITVRPAFAITQQPQDFTGAVGETATFTVQATGEGLTYRWQYKDPGGVWTNSSFKTPSMSCKLTAARDGRQYRCLVQDAHDNRLYSAAVTMTVKKALTITQQPQDFTGAVGETATFSVTAVGSGLTYQWQYREPGSSTWLNSSFKTPSMTCKITAARGGRQYRCVVTDAYGSEVISDPAAIIVTA